MNFSFNLIDENWIPCITNSGGFEEVSLRRLFAEAHEIREIACETPIQSAAIMPLLLAILHRNFGPANTSEWGELWRAGAFDTKSLEGYFAEWYDRFDLFHLERPFYQEAEESTEPNSVIHIVHSSANSGTLFNHANELAGVQMSPSEAARHLLAARLFHTSGTGPSVGGRKRYFKDSSFSRGVIFWARGRNLFATLMLNLVRYTDQYPLRRTSQDVPAWEMDQAFEARIIPYGYLDYLTWSNNRIKLFPDTNGSGVNVRVATVVPTLELSPDFLSPQKLYIEVTEKGVPTYKPIRFTSEKAIWRDYHTLLPQDNNDKLPEVIRWCARLSSYMPLPDTDVIQLMATGMATQPGQAKTYFYRQEIMPLPLHVLRDEDRISAIRQALGQAEECAAKLWNALNMLAEHVLKRGARGKADSNDRSNLVKQWHARERYWIALEPQFWRFIEALVGDDDVAIVEWAERLENIALEALRHASKLAGDSPWTLKGGIKAERCLRRQLNELLND